MSVPWTQNVSNPILLGTVTHTETGLGASHCPSPLSALLLIPLALQGFPGSSLFQGAFPDLTQSRS